MEKVELLEFLDLVHECKDKRKKRSLVQYLRKKGFGLMAAKDWADVLVPYCFKEYLDDLD